VRVKNLTDFVRQSNGRCDQIEQASKTIATLSEACSELGARLGPFMAADDGIVVRLRQLKERSDQLATNVGALERLPEGALADRIQQLADDKNRLDGGIADLGAHFVRLAGLRKDVGVLFAGLDRALDTLAIAKNGHGAGEADARIKELTRFVEETQAQFDKIEAHVDAFTQLRTRLGQLQTRLVPLDAHDSGVLRLIAELQEIRENLIAKIRRIEGGEQGDLAARVKSFAETKRELEERVSGLADQFTRLSTIRKDITGLFDKLASAVNGAAS
jgi:DNA repair exonuclease SbcCD ATPase subunit